MEFGTMSLLGSYKVRTHSRINPLYLKYIKVVHCSKKKILSHEVYQYTKSIGFLGPATVLYRNDSCLLSTLINKAKAVRRIILKEMMAKVKIREDRLHETLDRNIQLYENWLIKRSKGLALLYSNELRKRSRGSTMLSKNDLKKRQKVDGSF